MKLNDYLKKYKISQPEFAKNINYSRGNLNRVLRGQFVPSMKTLLKIKKATNNEVSFEDFVISNYENY